MSFRPDRVRAFLRSPWFRLLSIGCVAAAWLVFLVGQLPILVPYLGLVPPVALIAAVAWGAVYFAGLAFCWALVLERMGGARAGLTRRTAAHIWLRSMLTRYIPGNVWHILGRTVLADQRGVPIALVIASATVEQIVMLLAALAVAALTFPFWPVVGHDQLWLLALLPIGLVCLHPALFNRALAFVARLTRRPELAFYHSSSDLAVYLLAFVAAMLCSGCALVTLLMPLVPLTMSGVVFVLGAAALAWALGFLSFLTPSGLGVREAVLVGLLAKLFPLPVALAASLLFRLALTLGEVVAVGADYSMTWLAAKWISTR